MSNIQVGDEVLCINVKSLYNSTGAPPLRLNSKYIVGEIKTCKCGEVTYDVGIQSDFIIGEPVIHACCGRYDTDDGIWWCSARRFVKALTSREEVSISNAIKEVLKVTEPQKC